MKTTNSVILSETKNLIQSMGYETLHSVQGDTFRTFARGSKSKADMLKNSCKATGFNYDSHDCKINPTSPPLKIRGGRVGL